MTSGRTLRIEVFSDNTDEPLELQDLATLVQLAEALNCSPCAHVYTIVGRGVGILNWLRDITVPAAEDEP